MTDKEQLEEINVIHFEEDENGNHFALLKEDDYWFLLEQAEKAQKPEVVWDEDPRQEMLEDLYAENQELDKAFRQAIIDQRELNEVIGELKRENQRYREAIENSQVAIQKNLSKWNYKDDVSLHEVFVHNKKLLKESK